MDCVSNRHRAHMFAPEYACTRENDAESHDIGRCDSRTSKSDESPPVADDDDDDDDGDGGDAQKVRPTRREAAATLLLVSLPHASRMAARRMSLDDEEGTAAAVHAEDMCFGNEDACARRKVMIISPVRGLLHCGARRCDEAGKRYTGPIIFSLF